MRPAGRALLPIVGLMAAVAPHAAALPPGSGRAAEAFALCQLAEQAAPDVRTELLARGLALAEAAVDADANDALAHFAVFCNLARRAQAAGVSIASAFDVLRLVRELDATLARAPEDADVLAAKGAVLATLPRFLGGDPERSEQCLRRALALDPHHCVARSYLADALARRGAEDEARALRARPEPSSRAGAGRQCRNVRGRRDRVAAAGEAAPAYAVRASR